ncbi:MAG: HD domain-containing protein [Bacteroidales bacterium]|nr:HD domain-containing protein [Bacteroidales bacterium]
MANGFIDSTLLDKAIAFAVRAHHDTERRGKGFPYIVHPLEAVTIVATITSDQELLAAAALHDVVEDTEFTLADLRREFGERVARMVELESDKFVEGLSESDSWRVRKQAAIDRIEAAPRDAKIVAMGDKLSNMRAISRDYDELGDRLWERFHAPGGRADHEWHYRGLAGSLSDLAGTHAYAEFVQHIEHVFGKPRPEPIDLADYEVSGDGYTAVSYNHKDGRRMMKLYADYMPLSEPQRELQMAWSIMRLGIRIPKAYRMVTDGKRFGVEFERIAGKRSYARAISEEPGKLAEYTAEFARHCLELHATPCNTEVFSSAREHFRSVIDASRNYDALQKKQMYAFLDRVPEAATCLHGDMHIGNMIMAGGGSWWIDLADFRYGDPRFDLGMLYFVCLGNESDELALRLFHISHAQMVQVWDVFVRTYYGADADLEAVRREIAPFASLYMIHFANRESMLPHWRTHIENTLLG